MSNELPKLLPCVCYGQPSLKRRSTFGFALTCKCGDAYTAIGATVGEAREAWNYWHDGLTGCLNHQTEGPCHCWLKSGEVAA